MEDKHSHVQSILLSLRISETKGNKLVRSEEYLIPGGEATSCA